MLLTNGRISTMDAAGAVVGTLVKDIGPVLTMVGGDIVFRAEPAAP